jgi:hypothetical protein
LLSYQSYRAIIEAQGKNRMGVLFWMTHSAWPSLVFQTYDYYFEPTAAYFGCKKGSEPLHIQWNALTDSIEVVNHSIIDGENLTASIELINMDGSVKFMKHVAVNCSVDEIQRIYKLERPEDLSNVFFIRLKLEKGTKLISENFYWNGLQEDNFQDISRLPKVKLNVHTKIVKKNKKWFLKSVISNNSNTPTPMVKLKVIGNKDRKRILPVIFSDNYISLMPGEKREIKIEVDDSDVHNNKPQVMLEGVNVK